jgi:hypothetical protein
MALGEDIFPVRGIPGGSSPSVALGEGFPECFPLFPECQMHSGKPSAPVVTLRLLKLIVSLLYAFGSTTICVYANKKNVKRTANELPNFY